MKQLEAKVLGRVQGVYFRATTRQRAQELGISGWVRNEPDGSVRVVAEGEEASLQRLLHFLQQGPPAAVVTKVESRWDEASGAFHGFRVRP